MKQFLKVLILFVFLVSCNKASSVKSVHWNSSRNTLAPETVIGEHFEKPVQEFSFNGEYFRRYKQKMNGVEVYGSYATSVERVSRNGDKKISFLSAKFVNSLGRKDKRDLKELLLNKSELLVKIKEKHSVVSTAYSVSEPKVVLWTSEDVLKPVYQLDWIESNGEQGHRWFLDKDLEVFKTETVSSEFTGRGLVYPRGPKLSAVDRVDLPNLVGNGLLVTDNLKVTSRADELARSANQIFEYKEEDVRFSQVQVFHFAQAGIKLFEQRFGVKAPSNVEFITHIGFPDKKTAMFYFNNTVNLGEGDEVTYKHIMLDPSIVTHELMHFYLDNLVGIQQGAVNEAFADYLSCSLLQNPKLGEVSYLKSSYVRALDQEKKWSEINGGTYNDSLVLSSLLWEVRKTFGVKAADAFVFKIVMRLSPDSNLADVRRIILENQSEILSLVEQNQLNEILVRKEWISND